MCTHLAVLYVPKCNLPEDVSRTLHKRKTTRSTDSNCFLLLWFIQHINTHDHTTSSLWDEFKKIHDHSECSKSIVCFDRDDWCDLVGKKTIVCAVEQVYVQVV